MYTPGQIIIVSTQPEVLYVTIDIVIGPIPGKGWLVGTQEHNMLLLRAVGHEVAHARFITNLEEYKSLLSEVKR